MDRRLQHLEQAIASFHAPVVVSEPGIFPERLLEQVAITGTRLWGQARDTQALLLRIQDTLEQDMNKTRKIIGKLIDAVRELDPMVDSLHGTVNDIFDVLDEVFKQEEALFETHTGQSLAAWSGLTSVFTQNLQMLSQMDTSLGPGVDNSRNMLAGLVKQVTELAARPTTVTEDETLPPPPPVDGDTLPQDNEPASGSAHWVTLDDGTLVRDVLRLLVERAVQLIAFPLYASIRGWKSPALWTGTMAIVIAVMAWTYSRWTRNRVRAFQTMMASVNDGFTDLLNPLQAEIGALVSARLEKLEDKLQQHIDLSVSALEERLWKQMPQVLEAHAESQRDKLCKQIQNSVQQIHDLAQGSQQSWMVSELQTRLDSTVGVLNGLQVEVTAQGDINSQEHAQVIKDCTAATLAVCGEIRDLVKDAKVNDGAANQSVLTALKQTQALLQSLKGDVMGALAPLVHVDKVDKLEQNVDQISHIVWNHTNAHKSHDSKLCDLADASERVQQVLLKVQGQLDKIIGRLTPPMPQKAPPPPLPGSLAGQREGASSTPSAPATHEQPPPIPQSQPEPPVLNLREALPRQNVSLFSSLPPAILPVRWGGPLASDPRAQEALAYLVQALGANPFPQH
ncbi:unnamed protein product [Symbiodinium sp. CCMP2456]|nr:unnamed protein product [Symbiodinium sp. CCMP2456]